MDKKITITALVGQSGTGKSHHAVVVAKKVGAQAIIDDGLLIVGNKVAAGSSAKKEKTMLSSVKRALFTDPKHVEEVKRAIDENNIERLLILGTSEAMTQRIADTLDIGEVSKFIHIEDISCEQDIQTARELRRTEGKHIIPVPTIEIKKDFSGYFLHPLRLFRRNKENKEDVAYKTIVRPTYSYMGEYTISDNAIVQAVEYEANKIKEISVVHQVVVDYSKSSTKIDITVSIKHPANIQDVCKKLSAFVAAIVEKMTAINIDEVNVLVKDYIVE